MVISIKCICIAMGVLLWTNTCNVIFVKFKKLMKMLLDDKPSTHHNSFINWKANVSDRKGDKIMHHMAQRSHLDM